MSNGYMLNHQKDAFLGWALTGFGVGVSAASIQNWFSTWNPALQGIVFILTSISLAYSIYKTSKK